LKDLRDLEQIIETYEYIKKNKGSVYREDGKLKSSAPKKRHNPDLAEVMKENQEALDKFLDIKTMRQRLSDVQKAMIGTNDAVLFHLDLWDRYEKIYREQNDDGLCINGDDGCPYEALVNCKACTGKHSAIAQKLLKMGGEIVEEHSALVTEKRRGYSPDEDHPLFFEVQHPHNWIVLNDNSLEYCPDERYITVAEAVKKYPKRSKE
tara:strand:- start:373 stop:993 length:621 start_codon:yes stop_codon:yes gene_type:complete